MDHFEMVEKLRAKANVSYEEAKAALEASDWDMLDALVLLENEGKVKDAPEAKEYTTQEKKEYNWNTKNGEVRVTFSSAMSKLWAFLHVALLQTLHESHTHRGGEVSILTIRLLQTVE